MSQYHEVSFSEEALGLEGQRFDSVRLKEGTHLSEALDIHNSPVLFGCRTGICGTCAVRVEGELLEADAAEREILELYAPGVKNARLACQIRVRGALFLTPVGKA